MVQKFIFYDKTKKQICIRNSIKKYFFGKIGEKQQNIYYFVLQKNISKREIFAEKN